MSELFDSVQEFKKSRNPKQISGTLGIAINGVRSVEVPGRNSFVYVQLRNNKSELIQAFNQSVSPVFGLPVIVERKGNRYEVTGRDIQRYADWGGYSPFLPRHGDQHSFNPDLGSGGDIVWVYGNQFMPMLGLPSGTLGGPDIVVAASLIKRSDGTWVYAGGTGTPNFTQHKPTNNTGVLVLVYMDRETGNPGYLVGSGSSFAGTITGAAAIAPYIPQLTGSSYLPVSVVRLVSGTTSIGWANMYDAKQYYTSDGGTSSGGSSLLFAQDEGVPLGTVSTLNFVGSGIIATVSGTVLNINVTGGGGTGSSGGAVIVLFNHTNTIGSSGTTETDLYSDTLVASQLNVNQDKIVAEYAGNFVSSATATRQIKLKFAGNTIFDTGALTLSLAAAWDMKVLLMRVSATVIRYAISFATEGAALAAYTATGELTGLTLSSTNILKVTGQAAGIGAASNDIVIKLGTVWFVNALGGSDPDFNLAAAIHSSTAATAFQNDAEIPFWGGVVFPYLLHITWADFLVNQVAYFAGSAGRLAPSRTLTEDLHIADDRFWVVSEYLNTNGYDILLDSDADLHIV